MKFPTFMGPKGYSSIVVTYHCHLIFFDLITLTVLDEEYTL